MDKLKAEIEELEKEVKERNIQLKEKRKLLFWQSLYEKYGVREGDIITHVDCGKTITGKLACSYKFGWTAMCYPIKKDGSFSSRVTYIYREETIKKVEG